MCSLPIFFNTVYWTDSIKSTFSSRYKLRRYIPRFAAHLAPLQAAKGNAESEPSRLQVNIHDSAQTQQSEARRKEPVQAESSTELAALSHQTLWISAYSFHNQHSYTAQPNGTHRAVVRLTPVRSCSLTPRASHGLTS